MRTNIEEVTTNNSQNFRYNSLLMKASLIERKLNKRKWFCERTTKTILPISRITKKPIQEFYFLFFDLFFDDNFLKYFDDKDATQKCWYILGFSILSQQWRIGAFDFFEVFIFESNGFFSSLLKIQKINTQNHMYTFSVYRHKNKYLFT